MEPIIFDQETEAKFKKLIRFLSEGTGYTFATATDQRLIPELNKQLQAELPNTHILFFAENDITYIEQIRQAAEPCQGLIVMDIGELIRKNEYFIYTLNFAREEINAIGKPILFWMSNATLTKIANQANDLYTQRYYTNLHFEQKLPAEALDKSFDELIDTFEPDSEKQNRLSSIKVLEHQLAAYNGNKAAIAQNIALPLALHYAQGEQRHQAISLINEYEEYFNKSNALVLFHLATIYKLTYNVNEAINYYERALNYSESKELKATIYNQLGLIWQDLGNLVKAISLIEKAIAIHTELFGNDNANVATYYNNLGSAWNDKGDLEKALYYLGKALAIDLKIFGKENNIIAVRYNNIGGIWHNKGDLEKAIYYYTEALNITIKLFGKINSKVATCLNNLAGAWHDKGDLDKSIDYYNESLAINIELFGYENLQITSCYNNLGLIWQDQGDLNKAINYIEKALSINIKLTGAHNAKVATYYNNLGLVWQDKGSLDKAVEYFERALAIDENLNDEETPSKAIHYNNLGSALQAKGNVINAIYNLEKAHNIILKLYGADNPKTKTVKDNLDACLAAMKKP